MDIRFISIQIIDEINNSSASLNSILDKIEKEVIMAAITEAKNNKSRAAVLLNMNRTTLVEKMKRFGLNIRPILVDSLDS
jgi:DNA-binding NtrC family response regulator